MVFPSRYDSPKGGCAVCHKTWKKDDMISRVKDSEPARYCIDPNCSAPTGTAQAAANTPTGQNPAPVPQVSANALQLGFNDGELIALTDKVLHINKIVAEQIKAHGMMQNPALTGMITKYILDVEARK